MAEPKKRARSGPGRPSGGRAAVGINSAEHTIDVLNAVARSSGAVTLTQLSRLTRMAPSKLHRYLVSLGRSRMITRHETTGLYDLGPAALSLGATALTRLDGFDVVHEAIRRLSTELELNTFVNIWTEYGPVLSRSHSASMSAITLRIGSTVPMVSSGTGPVFATYLSARVTDPIITRDALAEDLDPVETARAMREEICPLIRRDKVYWSHESVLPNVAVCAAPVFDAQGELFCVIGAAIYARARTREHDQTVWQAVKTAAGSVSAELGHVPSSADGGD